MSAPQELKDGIFMSLGTSLDGFYDAAYQVGFDAGVASVPVGSGGGFSQADLDAARAAGHDAGVLEGHDAGVVEGAAQVKAVLLPQVQALKVSEDASVDALVALLS